MAMSNYFILIYMSQKKQIEIDRESYNSMIEHLRVTGFSKSPEVGELDLLVHPYFPEISKKGWHRITYILRNQHELL